MFRRISSMHEHNREVKNFKKLSVLITVVIQTRGNDTVRGSEESQSLFFVRESSYY